MDRRTMRKRLEEELRRLELLRRGVQGDLRVEASSLPATGTELAAQDQHPADLGSEMFEQEKTHSILASIRGEIHEVRRALHRVGDGSYGTCEACRRRIPAARLQALPSARYCVEDQARAERELRAS